MNKKCKWFPPPRALTKLNFDGASRGNLSTIGIECIINIDSGNWITKMDNSIGSTTNNLVKLEALQDLQICLNLGIYKLMIERDSQIVLNVIKERETPNWVLNYKLEEALNLLDHFKETQILHIS